MTAAALTPRAGEIARAARDLLDAEGPDALTMRRLASALGIRAPSLYKHFANKEALEAAIVALAFEEQAEAFEAIVATTDPQTQLAALANADRTNALARPHLYRLMNDRPLRRDLLPDGLETRAAAPLLAAAGGQDRARAAWAFAHGMTMLELNGRFPPTPTWTRRGRKVSARSPPKARSDRDWPPCRLGHPGRPRPDPARSFS